LSFSNLTTDFFSGTLAEVITGVCFGYPFVMSWYWIAGSLLYYFVRERLQPLPDNPPKLQNYPFVSVLLPCFNEEQQLNETIILRLWLSTMVLAIERCQSYMNYKNNTQI
jgi:cellulose synthase/poly-beta-1,6-N-acetylglucosamine synthase-like glycosyltransferase